MESFCYLDSENGGPAGKMNEEPLPKKPFLGTAVRKRLSDITNSQTHLKSLNQDEKLIPISFATKEYIQHLQKENMTLRKHLQERNKVLELTGFELTKMRINLQKLQQQNRLLAQANGQMTMLKLMQHELGCRGALLAVKDMEFQEKVKKKPYQRPCTAKKPNKKYEEVKEEAVDDGGCDKANDESDEVLAESAPSHGGDNKSCNLKRSRRSRVETLGCSAVKEQGTDKEKAVNKRKSASFKFEQQEPTNEKSDNKRFSLRRQSARFKSEQVEPTEDLFDLEDAKFSTSTVLDENMQEGATSSATEELKERKKDWNSDTPVLRTSIGRPMRRAAGKVQSYKEVPVNVKMRRVD